MRPEDNAPILLIEDDANIRALVGSLLDEMGAPVVLADSGRVGLARLQATTDHMVVVCSGVLADMSAAAILEAAAHDGRLSRRHAFVVVGPEQDALGLARRWETQVPLFTVLEPYSREELHAAVGRATQCVTLSRALYGVPQQSPQAIEQASSTRGETRRVGRAGEPRARRRNVERPVTPVQGTTNVIVVGGPRGIRQLIARLLSRAPYLVTPIEDEQVTVAWLRACLESVVVVLNASRLQMYHELLHSASQEACLVRHTYLLLLPTGVYVSAQYQELLGLLNAPVVRTPLSPSGLRNTVRELTATGAGAGTRRRSLV